MVRACAAVVTAGLLALIGAGCGGTSAASPVHQVNVFFDGVSHDDFRQACSVLEAKTAKVSQCEAYFTLTTALSGGGIVGHAVPHSEKITGDTATAKAVDSQGGKYLVTLARRHGRWVLTSITGT